MENASKALIIAGAILIAILLISVGIMVMNSVNKPVDQAKMQADAQAINIFNAKFEVYEGKNRSATQAKQALLLAQQEGLTIGSPSQNSKYIDDITLLERNKKYVIAFAANSDGKFFIMYVYAQTQDS